MIRNVAERLQKGPKLVPSGIPYGAGILPTIQDLVDGGDAGNRTRVEGFADPELSSCFPWYRSNTRRLGPRLGRGTIVEGLKLLRDRLELGRGIDARIDPWSPTSMSAPGGPGPRVGEDLQR